MLTLRYQWTLKVGYSSAGKTDLRTNHCLLQDSQICYWANKRIQVFFNRLSTGHLNIKEQPDKETISEVSSSLLYSPHFPSFQNPGKSHRFKQGWGMQYTQTRHSKGILIFFFLQPPHPFPYLLLVK